MRSFLLILLVGYSLQTDAVVDNKSLGSQLQILQDTTTKVTEGKPNAQCVWIRTFKVKYEYKGNEPDKQFIYYQVVQCKD